MALFNGKPIDIHLIFILFLEIPLLKSYDAIETKITGFLNMHNLIPCDSQYSML